MKFRSKIRKPVILDCTNCDEYIYGVGCIALDCPCLAERFNAGVVGYEEAVAYTFSFNRKLMCRLHTLVGDFPGTMWKDENHRQRFLYITGSCTNKSNSFYAAVYLLTASNALCKRVSSAFRETGLYFNNIHVQGISSEEYTLLSYAKQFYKGASVPLDELIDEELISEELFQMVVNAMMIAKHGTNVLKISKITSTREENENACIPSEQGT